MSDNSHDSFGIGTTRDTDRGPDYSILVEFEEAEYLRYQRALHNALAPTHRFETKLVELNFHGYLNHEKFAGTLIGLGKNFGKVDRRALTESVMSQIINWLTSFRLFLDYAETQLKRQFGSDSEQLKAFTARTRTAFDDNAGYRFVSKFRNYVQHCGPPISSVSLRLSDSEHTNPFIKQSALFLLDRNALLAAYKEWGPVRADLVAMGEQFELRPLAEEAMTQLREIELLLLDIAIAEGARTVSDLREVLDLLPSDADGVPTLFRFRKGIDESGAMLNITPQHFSREMVGQLQRVASGERTPADLHEHSQPPPLPEFDPATVLARFSRENRAVQALSLWQTEKGGTPNFQAGVNQMIQEDGGPEVLLTGMFNMTAVLLAMTATVLGVQTGGLLGGLLDVYAHQSSEEGDST